MVYFTFWSQLKVSTSYSCLTFSAPVRCYWLTLKFHHRCTTVAWNGMLIIEENEYHEISHKSQYYDLIFNIYDHIKFNKFVSQVLLFWFFYDIGLLDPHFLPEAISQINMITTQLENCDFNCFDWSQPLLRIRPLGLQPSTTKKNR